VTLITQVSAAQVQRKFSDMQKLYMGTAAAVGWSTVQKTGESGKSTDTGDSAKVDMNALDAAGNNR
jgi:hypothetical protein